MVGSAKKIGEEFVSFSGRIRAAMGRHGWSTAREGRDVAVVTLRARWIEFYKGRSDVHTPSRPTFYDWMKHRQPKISPRNLFLLSDVLNVNARWLALNEQPMAKPIRPDMESQALFDAWQHLGQNGREELLKEAQKLLRVQGPASQADPFKARTR